MKECYIENRIACKNKVGSDIIKTIKVVVTIFVVSLVFQCVGASAWTYFAYSYALKALKGETVQGELEKTKEGYQVLHIAHVAENRDIDFRISDLSYTDSNGKKHWIDSTWQAVSINGNPKYLQIHGGMFSGNAYIATFVGTKKLTMRTQGYHIGVTGIHGSWWVHEDEFNEYTSMLK